MAIGVNILYISQYEMSRGHKVVIVVLSFWGFLGNFGNYVAFDDNISNPQKAAFAFT